MSGKNIGKNYGFDAMYLGGQLATFYGYVATFVGDVATFSGYTATFGADNTRHIVCIYLYIHTFNKNNNIRRSNM